MTAITTVAVLGAGKMGTGIAQVCAEAGHDVVLLEQGDERLAAGLAAIDAFLAGGVERGKVTAGEAAAARDRITGTTDVAKLGAADLVIEAISEDQDAKLTLLRAVDAVVRADCLITTSTSALAVGTLATAVSAPGRFAGLHFFNPAPVMRIVEVVPTELTDAVTTERLTAFVEAAGSAAIVTKDRPGFLVNRVLLPYLNQALQAYDDGIATREDIDLAVELGLGYPTGPLRLLDIIGLDVHHDATNAAHAQLRDPHFTPPPLVARLVAAGHLGRKTGRGLYDYSEETT